jgi:drug/metabolite transporter (DMT)-like permease
MKVAIESIPPFIMAGSRFLIAGTILYVLARVTGAARPILAEWKSTGIVGALLILGGNGVVALAEQRVDSGVASLIVATVPLWVILFNWVGGQKKKPTRGVVVGIALGFTGIAVLVIQPGGADASKGLDLIGMLALLFAAISWSFGSLYSIRAKFPESRLLATAMQMLTGGVLLSLLSIPLGDWSRFDPSGISLRSYVAMGYLILFGSIVAYNAYIWLLKNAEASWVSTYAFVNPIVAVFLGTMWGGETLSTHSMIGAVIIIVAVAIITVFRNGGNQMSITKYAFIMNSESLSPALYAGALETVDFKATFIAVNSLEMAKEEASRFAESGVVQLDLCGDYDLVKAEEIGEFAGKELSVSYMTYLPEELEKLSGLSSMQNYGILLLHKSFDAAKNRLILRAEEFDTYVIGAGSMEQAVFSAKELVEKGIDFIELSSHFSPSMAKELIAKIDGKVPVGFAEK